MSDTFNDICRELSTDLATAVEAQTGRTLHPRTAAKKPSGIEEIRQRIQKAFETVRTGVAVELRPATKAQQVSPMEAAVKPTVESTPAKPRRPLTEIAAPILRVAESRFKDTRVRHQHRGAYFVASPNESVGQLFEAALACLPDAPKEAKWHEVAE
jgi:hypothetical protein